MGDVVKFKPREDARIEYMYAPEVDPDHPYAFRIECSDPNNGIWLSRAEYIGLIVDLVAGLLEEDMVDIEI